MVGRIKNILETERGRKILGIILVAIPIQGLPLFLGIAFCPIWWLPLVVMNGIVWSAMLAGWGVWLMTKTKY